MESTTYIIKNTEKSPLWNCIKVSGNDCLYFAYGKWFPVLDKEYAKLYLKFYEAVTQEKIQTETPEETEAFNRMKAYEFDEHASVPSGKKPIWDTTDPRTPKQKAVDQMLEDAEGKGLKSALERLYDKGYRKC